MAEQLQIRQIKLDDGTTLVYDGSTLSISEPDQEAKTEITLGVADADALIWLLTGRKPRRGGAKPGPKPKPRPGVTEPPAGHVPSGDEAEVKPA